MAERWSETQHLVHLLAGRWTLAVLAELANDGRRYQDLYDALDGISYKMLTETLRRAERDGLVTRHLDPGRIETATLYELTDLARSLDAPLAAMTFDPSHLREGSHLRVWRRSLKCRFP